MNRETETNLETMAAFPAALRGQVQPLDDATLRYKPEREWSAIENVGHLIDIEGLWIARFRQMLAAENPALAAIDVDETVRQRDYQHKDLANLLRTHAELRAETIEFIRGLKPLHFERTGIHPVRGPINLAQAVAILANHDRLHAEQIAKTINE